MILDLAPIHTPEEHLKKGMSNVKYVCSGILQEDVLTTERKKHAVRNVREDIEHTYAHMKISERNTEKNGKISKSIHIHL